MDVLIESDLYLRFCQEAEKVQPSAQRPGVIQVRLVDTSHLLSLTLPDCNQTGHMLFHAGGSLSQQAFIT